MRMAARRCTCHWNTTVSEAQLRSYIVHTDFIVEFAHKISLPTEQFRYMIYLTWIMWRETDEL